MKVLVANEDPVLLQKLEDTLIQWGYEVQLALDGEQACKILLHEYPPPIAILTPALAGTGGIEICKKIRGRHHGPYSYVLMLTGKNEIQAAGDSMRAGADDHISLPFNFEELQARLRAGQRVATLQETLRNQSILDQLTGLWSRNMMLEVLQRERNRAVRLHGVVSIMMADVDNFRQINDTHGRSVGDEVLRDICRRLPGYLRSYDLVGRYGGKTFLIVLPQSDLGSGMQIGDRVRNMIAATPAGADNLQIGISMSIGVTATDHLSAKTVSTLLRTAEEALRNAQKAGGNCIESAR